MTSPGALHQATSLIERAAELTDGGWDQVEGPDAVAAVEAITTARSFLDAALLRGIGRLEDTDALHDLGWATVKDYLTHLTGGLKGSGGGLVRAATQLRDLPAVQDALDQGRLTLPQARVIAAEVHKLPRVPDFRTAVADRMLDLVEEKRLDASDLRGAFDGVVADLDPDAEMRNAEQERARAERGAHQARNLSFTTDEHGGVRLTGYGTVEDAEKIKATLLPLAAPVTTEPGACGGTARKPGQEFYDEHGDSTHTPCLTPGCGHDGRDPREAGARMWDALVEACDRLRATETLPTDHGTTPRVVVQIDQESLTRKAIAAGLAKPGRTTTGASLSATVIRRLACDVEIIPTVLGTHGQILDLGRTHRLVTAVLWIALVARDLHCAFPGCTRMPLACDAHHITHWADGGTTSLDNLVMLCRHHHTLVHQTPWAVHIDPATGKPAWTLPPVPNINDAQDRFTYHPGRRSDASPPNAPPHAA